MEYVQLDNFNGNISLVCKDDGSGEVLVFNSLKEAEDTLEENCQDGIVVPLAPTIPLLRVARQGLESGWTQYSTSYHNLNEILDGNT